MICLIRGLIHQRFWFQYILFIVFVGGILVLFIYVASLASNEIFTLSTKITIIITVVVLAAVIGEGRNTINTKDATTFNIITNDEVVIITRKLYNQPNGTITILIALYLLMTLIVVVKITNISEGPLRQTS